MKTVSWRARSVPRPRRLGLAALVCLLALPAGASASDRLIDRWGVEEGLPNNAIADVLQSRDGYLWIATWAGAVRFDGVRFTPIAEGLPNDHARVLLEDGDGAVWIGMAGGGLARWRDGQLQVFTTADGLAGQDSRTIAMDRDGRIWVGSEAGLSIVQNGSIRMLGVPAGLPHPAINSLAASRDGGMWVATPAGLCRATAEPMRCEPVALPAQPQVVLEDRDGRLWVGTRDSLLVVGGTGGTHPACPSRCLQGQTITALRQSRDGDVWAGLGTAGVARLHAAGIEPYLTAGGLPPGTVAVLYEDLEGSMWVGVYNGGLARIKPRRVAMLSTADGLPAEVAGSIVQDRDGRIWAGTQCGPVSVWRNGRFVPQFVDEMRGACALVLWPARDGTLWIGTFGSGLYRWTGGRLDRFHSGNGLSDDNIAALFEDRDGTLWIGTNLGGLHLFREGRLSRAYGPADGVAAPYLASFAQDAAGRVWIGSNANGLSVYEDGRFRILPPGEQPPGTRNIAGLLIDSRGDLWIGSAANGLYRRRSGRYDRFGVEHGLGDRLVAVILEDLDGDLWVGTTRGISRLERNRIEAVAEGRASRLDPIILDRSDGMRNSEGSGGGLHPSGLRDQTGRLWFSTIDGIALIDPSAFATNAVVPAVLVETARVDDRPATRSADGALEVPAGTRSIEIDYTAFSFLAPQKVRFRYRLAGFEDGWHDVGARRAAYFSRLGPGEYTFEVMAANNDGLWSAEPARLRVVVHPFWWERRVVQAAAGALLLVATAMVVQTAAQRRSRRRMADLERERALERERTRIARDLHDDLGSRLTHLALMADGGEAPARLSDVARAAVESLDELVWAVNAKNDTVEGFAAYAGRFVEEHVAAAGLRCRLHFAPDLGRYDLPAETRRHLYLAFKEAVNNAVKHARASEVQVTLAVSNNTLRLDVSDNGRGFGHPGDPTGSGIANLRERMRVVVGEVSWLAAPGGGVLVRFAVPLSGGPRASTAPN